jgi:anti-sigma factor RsiW
MTRDELEFSISQYLDGTLGDAERDALDERLATDAEARAILGEYESLQRMLVAEPLPQMDWEALSNRISTAVSREELPAQSYKIGQWFSPARLAIAASALIAAGIGFSVLREQPASGPVIAAQPISIVATTPVSEPVQVSSEPVRVAIGPSPTLQNEPIILRYADAVVQRSSKALIVSAAPAGQDTSLTPF